MRARFDPVPAGAPRPLWSVMIPTYNCARFLGETLNSVLAQDPGPAAMQIEVVDDASSDDPQAVVEAIGRGRVGFFRQPTNQGHISNFATCIARSRGEIVHLLHGDDCVLPGFYTALGSGFAADPEIGAAFCRWKTIDEQGTTLSSAPPEQAMAGRLDDALARLAGEQRIVTPSIAVRRSGYEQLGGFDPRLACAEDWEMWVRIAASFPVWYEPQLLAAYRSHADSNTGRHLQNAEELRYSALAIKLFEPLLPVGRAKAIARGARRTYVRTALSNARGFAKAGDRRAMRAHLAMALRLDPGPKTLLSASRILLGRGR